MRIGFLKVDLHLPESGSLKAKRQILKSMLAKIRLKFNVAACELDNHNLWQRSTIGIVTIAKDEMYISTQFNKLVNLIKGFYGKINIIDYSIEMI